ncbi:Aste57867_8581 [Aphanomyces stellatus]|uniref:Aste57867_8581 protein n=1 Tax=Aphanomyces stellatus TaxID=120398 RepID=A0A485KKS7_9STRA|nr:hypothetical protein As57867_008549 [Aphanomyces stellatus]VFT85467.1 Aste57867_8581 [Aphanomyces stellatus]
MKRVHTTAAAVWSPDLFGLIARFLPDVYNLYNYLSAIECTDNIGDLAHLLDRIQDAADAESVWPVLRISSMTEVTPSLKAVVKFYSQIDVVDAVVDLSWLEACDSSSISIKAVPTTSSITALTAWFAQLPRLPVTSIVWSGHVHEPAFLHVLPQMHHLTSLRVTTDTNVGPLLAFVASSKLTTLSLSQHAFSSTDLARQDVVDAMLVNITTWLTSQLATSFSFPMGYLGYGSPRCAKAFLHALAHASSLNVLLADALPLSLLRSHSFQLPRSLAALNIHKQYIQSIDDVTTLESLLQHSNLVNFFAIDCKFPPDHPFQTFLDSLPPTLKLVALSGCRLTNHHCEALARYLPTSSIGSIDLRRNNFDDVGVAALIKHAFQSTTLDEIRLDRNHRLTETTIVSLIELAKAKPNMHITVTDCGLDKEAKERLWTLVEEHDISL